MTRADATVELTNDVERAEADPPASSPGGTDLEFRPDVEGLRAIAILLVVLYHSGVSWMPGGFLGVDVFFVISGFLITGLLLREHDRRRAISLPGFYARRSRRILPAAMLVIIVTILIGHHFMDPVDFSNGIPPGTSLTEAGKWASLFAANLHYANLNTDYFNQTLTPSPLLTYWSLAVEEQFYVVWPTIVLAVGFLTTLLVRRLRVRRIPVQATVLVVATGVSIASFLWSVHENAISPNQAYFSPFTRAWELGVGAMAASLLALVPDLRRLGTAVVQRWVRWAGIALGLGGVAMILVAAVSDAMPASATAFPPGKAVVPVLGAVAIIVGGATGTGAGWLLGYKPTGAGTLGAVWSGYQRVNPMRLIGRVSYGWYLLHYPPMILWAINPLWNGPLPVHERLLISGLTLVLAFAMYYALEKPIRRSRYLAARPWVSIAMGLALVFAAFTVATHYTKPL